MATNISRTGGEAVVTEGIGTHPVVAKVAAIKLDTLSGVLTFDEPTWTRLRGLDLTTDHLNLAKLSELERTQVISAAKQVSAATGFLRLGSARDLQDAAAGCAQED